MYIQENLFDELNKLRSNNIVNVIDKLDMNSGIVSEKFLELIFYSKYPNLFYIAVNGIIYKNINILFKQKGEKFIKDYSYERKVNKVYEFRSRISFDIPSLNPVEKIMLNISNYHFQFIKRNNKIILNFLKMEN